MSVSAPDIATLDELRASGWQTISVKEEIRRNVALRLRAGRPIVEGIHGYQDTVLPQVETALLAEHDMVLLGERGQAKTRLIRSLLNLLDEWIPALDGSDVNDDPYAPISRFGRDLLADLGGKAPIRWIPRHERFGEKLATPDVSMADLLGELDPIKLAEGRHLDDERALHYGLIPRCNRGIFAINELPDLSERIQVGLLNVLEERDLQLRGHRIRLPLDLLVVATANPEDYTNRGRIITPLKDRFGATIRTHYPTDIATELDVVEAESKTTEMLGLPVVVPDFMSKIVVELTHRARASSVVSKRSGVSVRASITDYETMVAAAARRAFRLGESQIVPRVSDLPALSASLLGKIEIESYEDVEPLAVFESLRRQAVLAVFRDHTSVDALRELVVLFDDGFTVDVGDNVPSHAYGSVIEASPVTSTVVQGLAGPNATPAEQASAVEFVLEGLHLSRQIGRDRMSLGASTSVRYGRSGA